VAPSAEDQSRLSGLPPSGRQVQAATSATAKTPPVVRTRPTSANRPCRLPRP